MKVKLAPYFSFLILPLFIFCSVPVSQAKSPGQISSMKGRADTVSKRKNRFVAKILNQSGINYTSDRHGIVTRVNFTGEWQNAESIDVVPMVRKGAAEDGVIGHEIFIYTDKKTAHLLSYLKIR